MKKSWLVAILLITASIFALDDFSVPHTWSPGDTIRDSDFEANNDTIEAWAARTNDSLDAKFLRTSAMGDSQWVKIKVDTLIADSIKARVLAITTYSPDSIYTRILKLSSGILRGVTVGARDGVTIDSLALRSLAGYDNTFLTAWNLDIRQAVLQGRIRDVASPCSLDLDYPGSIADFNTLVFDSAFVGISRVVSSRGAALTPQLTSLTHTAPGAPDYAIQNLTNSGSFGFVTADEGNTVLSIILNLQTRVAELEARLKATGGHGLIADP